MDKKIKFDKYDELEDNLPTISSGNDFSQVKKLADLMFWIDENKKHIPFHELVKRNAISDKNDNEFQVFRLLSRAAKNNANPLFRAGNIEKNDKRNALIFVWQSLINKKVKDIGELPKYKKSINKNYIIELIKISRNIDDLPLISGVLLEKGIALIIEPSLPGLGVDGLVYKNKYGNPIVALSLRYDRLDNFWFTLAHELSHIVLHYDYLDNPIVEDLELPIANDIEEEANYFASETIISSAVWRRCEFRRKQTEASLNELAASQNIHPILLAGKLRNEINNYEIFGKLVNKYSVRELLLK